MLVLQDGNLIQMKTKIKKKIVLPDIIDFIAKWVKQGRHYKDKQLKVTGIDFEMIDIATRNFLLEILSKRKLNSPILCAKDPQFIENVKFPLL